MKGSVYKYALDILKEDGTFLGQTSIDPDWVPAVEWASFQGIRQGQLAARMGSHPGTIEPVWDTTVGEPYVSGFRVLIPGENGEAVSSDFPKSYFRSVASEASLGFVKDGLLKGGDLFRFRVCAFVVPFVDERPSTRDEGGEFQFELEEVVRPLPMDEVPLRSFIDGAVDGDGGVDGDLSVNGAAGDDVPVLIPRHILDEAVSLCREAGDVEIGGVLLGKLHRDPEGGAIFLEVTAQIPAQHTVSEAAKLQFTPDTWAAVDAAIALRCEEEIKLGWFHYHPDWCRNCAPEKRRECKSSTAFFSGQDVNLHRVCFSSAYHIALLISSSPTGELGWHLFGWRKGEVVARGFKIIGDQQEQQKTGAMIREQQEVAISHEQQEVAISHEQREGAVSHEQRATRTTGRTTAGTTATAASEKREPLEGDSL